MLITRYIKSCLSGICLLLFLNTCTASNNNLQVAMTFDDLPMQGAINSPNISASHVTKITKKIIRVLKKHHMPPTWGMMNGKALELHPELIPAIKLWTAAGNKLGDHTYSHPDLAKLNAKSYIADIKHNKQWLIQLKQTQQLYFRYPFLAYGDNKHKYQTVRHYLHTQHEKIAYVTMDFFDSEWTPAHQRCLAQQDTNALNWLRHSYLTQSLNAIKIAHLLSQQLFHRDIKYVLLMHFGDIQAKVLDKLLTDYEQQHVKFITLEQAESDPIYQIDPKIYRARTYTLLNRIRLARSVANPVEVSRLYATLPEDKLNNICR